MLRKVRSGTSSPDPFGCKELYEERPRGCAGDIHPARPCWWHSGFSWRPLSGFCSRPLSPRALSASRPTRSSSTMPLTSQEIAADKDRLRARFALTIHRLERKVEEATHSAAKQMVEINRRDAGISALEGDAQRLRTSLDEHENARRVLEANHHGAAAQGRRTAWPRRRSSVPARIAKSRR